MTRLWLPSMTLERLTVRRGHPRDAAAIARVYVDSWRETYRDTLPRSYLNGLSYGAFERHWRRTFAASGWAFLAEVDGVIVGLVSGGRCRRPELAGGEIYVLYILQAHHGCGIGRALFDACHFELARRGHKHTLVWVLADNPACGFYARLGGRVIKEDFVTIGSVRLREVAYFYSD